MAPQRKHDEETPTLSREDLVLAAIIDLTAELGYPPTIRDIRAGTLMSSTSEVRRMLLRLREQGRVTFADGKSRTVRVVK